MRGGKTTKTDSTVARIGSSDKETSDITETIHHLG